MSDQAAMELALKYGIDEESAFRMKKYSDLIIRILDKYNLIEMMSL